MFSAGTLVPILSSAAYRMNELMKHMDFGPECFTNLDSPILHVSAKNPGKCLQQSTSINRFIFFQHIIIDILCTKE